VFLLYNDGRLIKHYSRTLKPDQDEAITSGMLFAIKTFIEGRMENRGGSLREIKFGENKILVDKGNFLTIAIVIERGSAKDLTILSKHALEVAENRFENVLVKWDGDREKLAGLDKIMRDMISGRFT
jgi:hypothetical protein